MVETSNPVPRAFLPREGKSPGNEIEKHHSLLAQSRTQSLQAFWSAGQRREDSGDIEFYYRRISAVKQWKPLRNSQSKKLNFFDAPLTKKPEDSGYEIAFGVFCLYT